MIRLVLPNRGIDAAMSSSRSTYSTPSAIAARNSNSRCSSVPANFPPSTGPAAGDHDRAGPIGHQPPDVHLAVDVVQSQFDQLRALVDQVPMFRNDVPVPAATNADANHGRGGRRERLLSEDYCFHCQLWKTSLHSVAETGLPLVALVPLAV